MSCLPWKLKAGRGHKNYIKHMPYSIVRKSGFTDVCLFQKMVKNIMFDLYLKETVSLEIKVNKHGRLVKGPVMWTVYTGEGQLTNLNNESWDEWAAPMIPRGVIINRLLPNSVTVLAIMDHVYCASKAALCESKNPQSSHQEDQSQPQSNHKA